LLRSVVGVLLVILAGCAATPAYMPETQPLEPGRLPTPDVAVNIPGLGPCTDAPDRSVPLNSRQPVTVLVHGCKGSAGRFRSLAQLLSATPVAGGTKMAAVSKATRSSDWANRTSRWRTVHRS
jgi:hypothetical protein